MVCVVNKSTVALGGQHYFPSKLLVSLVVCPAFNRHGEDGVRLEPSRNVDVFVEARISVHVGDIFRLVHCKVRYCGEAQSSVEGKVSSR